MAEELSPLRISQGQTTPIPGWKFVPQGELIIDSNEDKPAYYGEVYYQNKGLEIVNAIRIKEWVFVLERWYPNYPCKKSDYKPNEWFIASFYKSTHASYSGFIPDKETFEARFHPYLGFLLSKIWPILDMGDINPNSEGNLKYEWRPFRSQNQVDKYIISGGVDMGIPL